MVEDAVLTAIRRYMAALPAYGIHASKVILYGSHASGKRHEWSDIDVIVVAPEFDGTHDVRLVENLWLATEAADDRIEPIACGEREWETDEGRPIIEIARQEGIEIAA